MKTRLLMGLLAAVSCLVMPFLCRIPRGAEWVGQYIPEGDQLAGGMLFFGAFAMLPAVVVFSAALISRPSLYLPLLISTVVALALLGCCHYNNDLSADAQAALSLVVIPIVVAAAALVSGLIGWAFQAFMNSPKVDTSNAR